MLNSFIAKPFENDAAAELFKKQLHWMLFVRVVFLTLLLGINFMLQSAEKHIIVPSFYYVVAFILYFSAEAVWHRPPQVQLPTAPS
ncbi:MAG: hypothetical protein P8Y04_09260 [Desulfobulbaceae bacterium]